MGNKKLFFFPVEYDMLPGGSQGMVMVKRQLSEQVEENLRRGFARKEIKIFYSTKINSHMDMQPS